MFSRRADLAEYDAGHVHGIGGPLGGAGAESGGVQPQGKGMSGTQDKRQGLNVCRTSLWTFSSLTGGPNVKLSFGIDVRA